VLVDNRFTIEFDREEDGRWIAEVVEFPGILAYGWTQEDAKHKVLGILRDAIELVDEMNQPPL